MQDLINMTSGHKVGFLLSAGGAAFARSVQLSGWPTDRFHVVTDRDCDALVKAANLGIACEQISATSRSDMSTKVAEAFVRAGCEVVISHFSRMVGPELFERVLTVNVHPALLPAYPGLDGVGDAARAGAPIQGATLHLVDEGIDTGPVLAQTAYATPRYAPLAWRYKLAYRQKIVMTLIMLDWLTHNLVNPLHKGLSAFKLSALPVGDTFCTPGFSSLSQVQNVIKLFNDLEMPRQ
jgi:phosphoribosylglycinamide formyltransferase-1